MFTKVFVLGFVLSLGILGVKVPRVAAAMSCKSRQFPDFYNSTISLPAHETVILLAKTLMDPQADARSWGEFFIDRYAFGSDETGQRLNDSRRSALDRRYRFVLDSYNELLKAIPEDGKVAELLGLLKQDYLHFRNQDGQSLVDLLEGRGGNDLAQTEMIVAVIKDLGLKIPASFELGIQISGAGLRTVVSVLVDKSRQTLKVLNFGKTKQNIEVPVYSPKLLADLFLYKIGEKKSFCTTDYLIAGGNSRRNLQDLIPFDDGYSFYER